jgi:dihydrofolate reductase
MRKIILNLAVSLDGFIEGPNGEYDWCILDPEMDFQKFLDSVDAVFYGRKSYELFGNQDPETFGSDFERDTYRRIAEKKKYVFSATLESVPEGDVLVKGDIKREVDRIRNEEGADIWLFGGASLVEAFIREGLIDEYQLALHPVALGVGKPLFTNLQERLNLRLLGVREFASGVVMLRYG